MSSKNYDKMRTLFERLPVEERWAFMDFAKITIQGQLFNLSDLAASKENSGIECPHCRCTDPNGIVKFGVRVVSNGTSASYVNVHSLM